MKRFLFSILLLIFIFNPANLFAQLSGIKTIDNTLPTGGNNYNSFTDAIITLNASGVGTGGVIFNVSAGQTFDENPPEITATGTAPDSIVFQKSGSGANPVLKPNTAGTLTTSTLGNHGDGIVIINGGDYIIFDGIDIDGNNTFSTTAEKFEYGFYFKKASAVDACKNITIRNCKITLYHSLAAGSAVTAGSGIFISNISGTTSAAVSNTGGRTENIQILNNTISGAYTAIQIRGFAAPSPYNFYDQNITISGNNIPDYGGGSASCHTLYTIYANNLVISDNTFLGGGTNTGAQYGVYCSTAINSNIDITGNTFTLTNGTTTQSLIALYISTGATTGTDNAINVTGNIFTDFSRPNVTSGVTYIIQSTSNYPNLLNVSGNTISNMIFNSTGTFYGIYQISNPVNFIVSNNIISNIFRTSATGTGSVWAIYNSSTSTGAAFTAGSNLIYNIGTVFGGTVAGIAMSTSLSSSAYNNTIYDLSAGGTSGLVYGIYCLGTSPNMLLYNNFISNLKAPDATNINGVIGINIAGSPQNVNIYYNSIHLNASGTGPNFGSSGIHTVTAAMLDLKNNLIINNSVAGGGTNSYTVAYRRNNTTLTTYSQSSNFNDFYAGTPSSTNLIFYDGTNRDSTLQDYKVRVEPRDSSSISKMVYFVDVLAGDLHLADSSWGDFDLAGIPVTAITTDIDGDVRDEANPYMGADEASVPLPVELISFTASVQKNNSHGRINVILNWSTATETNNQGFEIEKRTPINPGKWINIGFAAGYGTSTEPKSYSFVDDNVTAGKYLYRLKQIDFDGTYSYSNGIEIEIDFTPSEYVLHQNYPNPFNPNTTIKYSLPFESQVKLVIYNVLGEKITDLVNSNQDAGNYEINWSATGEAGNLASGIYFYTLTAKSVKDGHNFNSVKKMLLLK